MALYYGTNGSYQPRDVDNPRYPATNQPVFETWKYNVENQNEENEVAKKKLDNHHLKHHGIRKLDWNSHHLDVNAFHRKEFQQNKKGLGSNKYYENEQRFHDHINFDLYRIPTECLNEDSDILTFGHDYSRKDKTLSSLPTTDTDVLSPPFNETNNPTNQFISSETKNEEILDDHINQPKQNDIKTQTDSRPINQFRNNDINSKPNWMDEQINFTMSSSDLKYLENRLSDKINCFQNNTFLVNQRSDSSTPNFFVNSNYILNDPTDKTFWDKSVKTNDNISNIVSRTDIHDNTSININPKRNTPSITDNINNIHQNSLLSREKIYAQYNNLNNTDSVKPNKKKQLQQINNHLKPSRSTDSLDDNEEQNELLLRSVLDDQKEFNEWVNLVKEKELDCPNVEVEEEYKKPVLKRAPPKNIDRAISLQSSQTGHSSQSSFFARPVPNSTHLPLFKQILESRDLLRKAKRLAKVNEVQLTQNVFHGIEKRTQEMLQRKEEKIRTLKEQRENELFNHKFKANPIDPRVLAFKSGDLQKKLDEENDQRKLRIKMGAEELMTMSKLPPRMQLAQEIKSNSKKRGDHNQGSGNGSDYDDDIETRKNYKNKVEKQTNGFTSTVSKPFPFNDPDSERYKTEQQIKEKVQKRKEIQLLEDQRVEKENLLKLKKDRNKIRAKSFITVPKTTYAAEKLSEFKRKQLDERLNKEKQLKEEERERLRKRHRAYVEREKLLKELAEAKLTDDTNRLLQKALYGSEKVKSKHKHRSMQSIPIELRYKLNHPNKVYTKKEQRRLIKNLNKQKFKIMKDENTKLGDNPALSIEHNTLNREYDNNSNIPENINYENLPHNYMTQFVDDYDISDDSDSVITDDYPYVKEIGNNIDSIPNMADYDISDEDSNSVNSDEYLGNTNINIRDNNNNNPSSNTVTNNFGINTNEQSNINNYIYPASVNQNTNFTNTNQDIHSNLTNTNNNITTNLTNINNIITNPTNSSNINTSHTTLSNINMNMSQDCSIQNHSNINNNNNSPHLSNHLNDSNDDNLNSTGNINLNDISTDNIGNSTEFDSGVNGSLNIINDDNINNNLNVNVSVNHNDHEINSANINFDDDANITNNNDSNIINSNGHLNIDDSYNFDIDFSNNSNHISTYCNNDNNFNVIDSEGEFSDENINLNENENININDDENYVSNSGDFILTTSDYDDHNMNIIIDNHVTNNLDIDNNNNDVNIDPNINNIGDIDINSSGDEILISDNEK